IGWTGELTSVGRRVTGGIPGGDAPIPGRGAPGARGDGSGGRRRCPERVGDHLPVGSAPVGVGRRGHPPESVSVGRDPSPSGSASHTGTAPVVKPLGPYGPG